MSDLMRSYYERYSDIYEGFNQEIYVGKLQRDYLYAKCIFVS
jgi:hypothetical protein